MAIAFAGLSGYMLVVFQSIDNIKTSLLDNANRINRLRYDAHFLDPALGVDPEELSGGELGYILKSLASGVSAPIGRQGRYLTPRTDAERARDIAVVAYAFANRYPFPSQPSPVAIAGHTAVAHRQEIVLSDVEKVRAWLPHLENALMQLTDALQNQVRLQRSVTDADEEFRERFKKSWRRTGPRWRSPAHVEAEITQYLADNPMSPYAAALNQLVLFEQEAARVAEDTRTALGKFDRYRGRFLPSRWRLILVILALLAAFVCGVAIPMVHPAISSFVAAWVPAAIYVFALASAAYYVVRRYYGKEAR